MNIKENAYQNQATLCRRNGTLLALRELPKVKGEKREREREVNK